MKPNLTTVFKPDLVKANNNQEQIKNIQEGVGYFQQTAKFGKRCSSATAYLNGIKKRTNLSIFTKAKVTKIVFVRKKATGVCVQFEGRKLNIFSNC